VRVVIADDHRIVRDGIRWMLANESSIEIVGEAKNGEVLLDLLDKVETDVVLLDMKMPGLSGLDVLVAIRRVRVDLAVLLLTMYDDPQLVKRAVELGADGYLPKSADRDELISAIQTVGRGGHYLHGALVAPLVKTLTEGGAGHRYELSAHEGQALRMVAAGLSNKEIAVGMSISEADAKACLHRVFGVLGARSRSHAVAIALCSGLID
jgi:two-component system, NarL family, nitrate/nitrite response regulator NarL